MGAARSPRPDRRQGHVSLAAFCIRLPPRPPAPAATSPVRLIVFFPTKWYILPRGLRNSLLFADLSPKDPIPDAANVQRPMRHGHSPRTRPSTARPAGLTLLQAEVFRAGGAANAGGTLLWSRSHDQTNARNDARTTSWDLGDPSVRASTLRPRGEIVTPRPDGSARACSAVRRIHSPCQHHAPAPQSLTCLGRVRVHSNMVAEACPEAMGSLGVVNRRMARALVLIVVLAPLPFGSNRPWAWSLLALAAGALLLSWAWRSWRSGAPAAVAPARVGGPMLLFLLVCLYAGLQAVPGLPDWLANPYWQLPARLLGEAPRNSISIDPAGTITALMRLLTYGAIFWLALQSFRPIEQADRADVHDRPRRRRLQRLRPADAFVRRRAHPLVSEMGPSRQRDRNLPQPEPLRDFHGPRLAVRARLSRPAAERCRQPEGRADRASPSSRAAAVRDPRCRAARPRRSAAVAIAGRLDQHTARLYRVPDRAGAARPRASA